MINYKHLDDSLGFFGMLGYQRVEAPWTVTEAISNITKPKEFLDFQFKHNDKVLVGSGEQSFLYLYLKGFLPKGKYQTVTPCFRYESFDFLHSKYFMKNEVINTITPNEIQLGNLVRDAKEFFGHYFHENRLSIVNTTKEEAYPSYDIVIEGYELGSYGIRECEFLKWIYGTACAEPRMNNIMKMFRDKGRFDLVIQNKY
jgi:hypothetical protein